MPTDYNWPVLRSVNHIAAKYYVTGLQAVRCYCSTFEQRNQM
jgi:hypothetical protein